MAEPTAPAPPVPVPLLSAAEQVEKDLGAPSGSLISLLVADDWSFIIRAHALVEGAISALLAGVLDPRLRHAFSHLELGRADSGKLEFSKALDVTTTEERRFIRKLSALRNVLAHDMAHLAFSLEAHIALMKSDQRKDFYASLEMNTELQALEAWRAFVKAEPKLAIFGCVLGVMTKAILKMKTAELDSKQIALAVEYAEQQRQFWTNITSVERVDRPEKSG